MKLYSVPNIKTLYKSSIETSFGKVFVLRNSDYIFYLGFNEDKSHEAWSGYEIKEDENPLKESEIFTKSPDFKLVVKGSEFELSVWATLLKIPFGKVASYKDVAVMIGKKSAVRAVANVVGKNHIGYLVPCHRVIYSNGGIGGFGWGVELKRKLLRFEGLEF